MEIMTTPENDQELIEEIRALNTSISVDEQELQKKKDLRCKYIVQLSNSLGKIAWQIMKSREKNPPPGF
jgi:predicted Zn-dependent peptidase